MLNYKYIVMKMPEASWLKLKQYSQAKHFDVMWSVLFFSLWMFSRCP